MINSSGGLERLRAAKVSVRINRRFFRFIRVRLARQKRNRMQEINFPHWPERLAQAALPDRQKQSFAITLRWYLSFCRRSRVGVSHESARGFIAWAQQTKQPEAWQVEGWKEAIRWFFRAAKAASADRAVTQAAAGSPPPAGPGVERHESTPQAPQGALAAKVQPGLRPPAPLPAGTEPVPLHQRTEESGASRPSTGQDLPERGPAESHTSLVTPLPSGVRLWLRPEN